ncbi:MAG TPA: hypothetical protein VLI06_10880 [Solimonas sp.]|nr:hypothetical protein [Solimonas sp.]
MYDEIRRSRCAFTEVEAALFQVTFRDAAARLPVVFRSFWHRWDISPQDPCALLVFSETGQPTLRIERGDAGYRIFGLTDRGERLYVDGMPSMTAALRACGLL